MADMGYFALVLALFLSSYGILADQLGSWRRQSALMASGRNAMLACVGCLCVAVAALLVLLVRGDFSISYVAGHTSNALPLVYKVTALWAGASGSLLFWLWLQVFIAAAVFRSYRGDKGVFCANARAIINLVSVFFLLVLILDKNPFALSVVAPADGAGLNPLLQHPAMVLHPPALFVGYAALVVPFAWAFASLKDCGAARQASLFAISHRWLLFAWLFVTVGIGLGAWWAYEELGWGGYWAWDPVENSSLMPWLTATALLHCARTYRDRSATARWFTVLSLGTFSLCIFGTFLTRYGLVSSVHAFPEPGMGILFLVLLIHIWVLAGLFWIRRWRKTRGEGKISASVGQRFIVWNSWLMVGLVFVIFVGTLFPFLSGLFSKEKISLKAEYFTKITSPGGLLLLLLIGMCPHLLRHGLKKHWRLVGALVAAVIAGGAWVLTRRLAPACFVLCAFTAVNLAADFVGRYIHKRSTGSAASRHTLRWYGARIVHIGVLLVFLGMAGSEGYDTEEEKAMRPHEKIHVGGYDLVYDDLRADHGANFTAVTADISVYRDGEPIGKLHPARAYYNASERNTSEVDVRRTLGGDLYLALTNVDTNTRLINLLVLVKPLINWIWIGCIVSIIGTVLVMVAVRGGRSAAGQDRDREVRPIE